MRNAGSSVCVWCRRWGAHGDEGSCVGHEAGVFSEPLLQISLLGGVFPSQAGAIFEVDDGDPALHVPETLTRALVVGCHWGHGHTHLADATPPWRHLETQRFHISSEGVGVSS